MWQNTADVGAQPVDTNESAANSTLMDFKRRYLFHGHASAIGGRIVRHKTNKPIDLVIETTGDSSLTPVGGRSHGKARGEDFDGRGLVSFGWAETFAEGLFENHRQVIAASQGRLPEDALVATSRVGADIHDLVVGIRPQLTVKRLRATLHSRSPYASEQPSIQPIDARKQTVIEGVFIDGHELIVELNTPVFQKYDTHAKLLAAADEPKFVAANGHVLFMRSGVDKRQTPATGRLVTTHHQHVHGTLVSKLRWRGKPFPGAQIDHHSVKIPRFGRVFFGELLLDEQSRRLTMMRVNLGSTIGGQIAAAVGDQNGIWS
jgi:hypothetical protein